MRTLPPTDDLVRRGSLEQIVYVALRAADRDKTPAGAAAMHAAALLDLGGHTGASAASLIREMRQSFADAVAGASSNDDALDELRARRVRKA